MRWLLAAVAGLLIGASVFTTGSAHAQPAPTPPPGPPGSTTDDLADMVMDVIEHGAPAIPTTTPVPAPTP